MVRGVVYTAGQAQFEAIQLFGQTDQGAAAVLKTRLPRIGPPGGEPGFDPALQVVVTKEGLEVRTDGAAAVELPCPGACTPNTYDYRGLARLARGRATQSPPPRQGVVLPAGDVTAEVVMRVMDALTADASGELFGDLILAGGPA